MFKRIFALLLALLLSFSNLPAIASSNGGSENYDHFYSAVTQLTASRWDDSYFGSAAMSVGGKTLEVDGSTIMLSGNAEVIDDELLIPAEVFTALGATVSSDAEGIVVGIRGINLEISYDEDSFIFNGEEIEMPAAAVLRSGKPILPASLLGELGLGFEILFDEATGEITITNDYQMARVVAKASPGKPMPKFKQAVQTLAGPDGLHVIQFDSEEQAKAAVETLNASSNVLFAEPDMFVSLISETPFDFDTESDDRMDTASFTPPAANGENTSGPTGFSSSSASSHLGWGPGRIRAGVFIDYLVATGKQSAQVIVAVLDTGLTAAHPIFSGRHVPGRNFISAGAPPNDGHSHGTHVSGTVLDVAISLPNVKIMPVKVLSDTGSGTSVGVANGIRWAADNEARVINLSLGGNHSQITDDAVNYAVGKNVTVVAAAGNDNSDAKNCCPAHNASAITVSAFNSADWPAPFTNYGTVVDVAAPGVGIVSAMPGGGTASMSGTSMAAPHVAGAAALLLCDNPSLTPADVKSMIRENVDPITTGTQYYGTGILNIGKAAGTIKPADPPAEPQDPPEMPQPPQEPEPPVAPKPPQRPVPPEAPQPPQEPDPPERPKPPLR